MTDSVRKDFKEMNVDRVITVGGSSKYIQAPDVCCNKPFKARKTEFYDQWLSKGVNQFTEGENMNSAYRKIIVEWVLDAWSQLS